MNSSKPVERVALVVLTLNPGPAWIQWLTAFKNQSFSPDYCLVIDSQSDDSYPPVAIHSGFMLHTINKEEFGHAKTRQLALDILPDADIIIFMTQDAILKDSESLKNLIQTMRSPDIGAAYGRQIPRKNASPIEAHARLFNYPGISRNKSLEDVPELGIKTPFMSNSFSVYRKKALMEVGGFPLRVQFGEDVYVSSKMILKGWRIAYVAEATVYHSHHYSYLEEFRRYLKVGKFYGEENWIAEAFGKTGGEGFRYVISELKYLIPKSPHLILSSLTRTFLKLVGYHAGKLLSGKKWVSDD